MIRSLLFIVLFAPLAASAACSARAINPDTLLDEARQLHAAGIAVRQSAKFSEVDYPKALDISINTREIFTEASWLSSLIHLHGKMIDKTDRSNVDALFKIRVSGFVDEIGETIKYINETSGLLKSAGVAAHIPTVTAQMTNLQKILTVCR